MARPGEHAEPQCVTMISMTSQIDTDVLLAVTDLLKRTGATEFNVGYLHDDVPSEEADWYAYVQYQGARLTVEHHSSPTEAAEALARRVLTGGRCKCGKLVALDEEGAQFFPGAAGPNGEKWTAEEAAAAGQCQWKRVGPRWNSECEPDGERRTLDPVGDDEVHTAELLARALEAEEDPALTMIANRARVGYYHDYLSPLALPTIQLVTDLRAAKHEALAARVMNGEFDASAAESQEWMSTEGQQMVKQLAHGSVSSGGNRAQRRAARKKQDRSGGH